MYFLIWLFCSTDLKSDVFKSVILFFCLPRQQRGGKSKNKFCKGIIYKKNITGGNAKLTYFAGLKTY
jgi:hypothetical protein